MNAPIQFETWIVTDGKGGLVQKSKYSRSGYMENPPDPTMDIKTYSSGRYANMRQYAGGHAQKVRITIEPVG